MKNKLSAFIARCGFGNGRLTGLSISFGFAVTVLFAFYNGILGILHFSVWHGSICAYYLLLSLLRGGIIAAGRTLKSKSPDDAIRFIRKTFRAVSGAMLGMNAVLTAPALLMVFDRRPVQMGLIPAIASATYTTYKITSSAIKLNKGKHPFRRELGVIQLIDALVSVLILQNTLIIAVDGGITEQMFTLVAVSSAGILVLIFFISLLWFVRGLSTHKKNDMA